MRLFTTGGGHSFGKVAGAAMAESWRDQQPPQRPATRPRRKSAAPASNPTGGSRAKEEEKRLGRTPEPHRVIGKLGCTGINVYGWLDMGATVNPDNPASRYNGTLAPNDRNEFQFNQTLPGDGEDAEHREHGWDIGGRVDLFTARTISIANRSASRPTATDRQNGTPASIRLGDASSLWRSGLWQLVAEARPFLYDHRLRVDDGHEQLLLFDELCRAICRADHEHGRPVHWKK